MFMEPLSRHAGPLHHSTVALAGGTVRISE